MKKITLLTSFLTVLLCSCTHYYYVANIQNVPLFREKNEFRFSGTVGGGDESSCIEAQTGYSVTDNIGIMANFMSARGGNVSSKNYGKGNYLEGAIGYYKPEGKYGIFEVYGGLGGSNQYHEYSGLRYNDITGTFENVPYGSADLSYLKFFIQPSYGITLNLLDVALSARFCSVDYNIKNNNASGSSDEYDKIYSLANTIHFNVEPALTVRAGWKNIKVQFQAEYAGLINNGYQSTSNNQSSSFGEDWHLSIGLNIAFAKRFKQSDKKN
jgi:hypothetical protein